MAKDQGVNLQPTRGAARPARPPAKPTTAPSPAVSASPPKKRTTPAQFYREVRVEVRKITWPSWKETWVTSVMVLIMVVIAAIFLALTDGALTLFVQQILKLGA